MVKRVETSIRNIVKTTAAAVLVALGASEVALTSQVDTASTIQSGIELYWSGRYRETVDTLSPVCASDGGSRVDELVECFKYVAFSHVALGNTDHAVDAFARVLDLDSGFALDASSVSPKILDHFEASKLTVVDRLFARGKELYFADSFAEASSYFDQALSLVPQHELAMEYKELADERAALHSPPARGGGTLSSASEVASSHPTPAPTVLSASHVEVEPTIEERRAPPAIVDPDEDRVYHLTSQMTRPELVAKRDPVYPESAKRTRRQGTVVITAVIDRDGTVRDAKVIRAVSPDIDNAALSAVLSWRYTPATLDGRSIAVYSVIQIAFQL